MSQRELTVTKREITGKEANKRLRRDGKLPAVLYGHGETPVNFTVGQKEFSDLLHHNGLHSLLVLKGDGGGETAVIKSIQKHPVKGTPATLDFLRVSRDEKITVTVAVVLDGEPLDVKTGDGLLVQSAHEVQVRAASDSIPDNVHLDISGLVTDGPALTAESIVLPAGVELVTDPSETIVAVNQPSVVKEEEPTAEAEAPTESPESEATAEAE